MLINMAFYSHGMHKKKTKVNCTIVVSAKHSIQRTSERVNECLSFSNTQSVASFLVIDSGTLARQKCGVYFLGVKRNRKGKQVQYKSINFFFFKLKITLPNGAIVQYMYKVGLHWLYHIYVTPSIFDEDNVEGLCGNPNGKADDFIPQGSSFPTSNMVRFQKSWR